ncbi:MAG: cysteine peptidase family C39 domain-containing protein, partial [Limnochordia bacterium]
MNKRFVCVKQQSPADCGAACLATVAKHYGLKVP